MSDVLLRANSLHKTYRLGRTSVTVLRGVSLTVREGELVAIMGASGSGKSTLLHLLGALDVPDKGTVHIAGKDVFGLPQRHRDHIRNHQVGFIFQFYHLLPELNVLENALMPRMVANSIFQWPSQRAAAQEHVTTILDRVGLRERLNHRPNELSGGERQRVAIARAMANKPRLLLADEPTGNLDGKMGREILDVLRFFNENGQTIVLVTHDPNIAEMADRCVHLVDGRIES